jgi:hypothetical protein
LFTIRLGPVMSQASLVFYLFWVASISSPLKRIEGALYLMK